MQRQYAQRPRAQRWRRFWLITTVLPVFMLVLSLGHAQEKRPKVSAEEIKAYEDYKAIVGKTAAMVADRNLQRLAAKHGLQVLNLTWEDTARYQNSAVGPNISDMTIQMQQRDPRTGQYHLTCMPVIRFPNFTDKTADIAPAKFYLPVGNEKGKDLKRVNLLHFLANIRGYLHNPKSWKDDRTYLHANRDTHVLVSAQACFLPVPKNGIAEFNPVLFNYQSRKEDPAVLTIMVTREGTSVTVIDNVRDGFQGVTGRWGQRLFFNKNGKRCSLTGQRLSDFGSQTGHGPKIEAAGESGMNMVLLIQVPLKQRNPMRFNNKGFGGPGEVIPLSAFRRLDGGSNVENAVIGHGKVEGPFTEIDNLPIERDPRYPVRVTVQFYKATSNGVVSEKDMAAIAAQIQKVYKKADYVGSLVVDGTKGRPTEYEGNKVQPPDWWQQFWKRYEQNTGYTREQALRHLRKHHGNNWCPLTERVLADEAEKLPRTTERPGLQARLSQIPATWPVAAFSGCVVAGGFLIRLRRKTADQHV